MMQKIFCSFVFLFSVIAVAGQIIFEDYYPDFISSETQSTFSIDLNNDGLPDCEIKTDTTISADEFGIHTDRSIIIKPLQELYVLSNDVFATALEENFQVDANSNWPSVPLDAYYLESNYLYISYEGDTIYHHNSFTWPDSTNFYFIAFKHLKAANPYYGWLKLKVNTGNLGFTVDSYAYNDSPGKGLQTGQTSPALESVQFEITNGNIVFLVPPELINEDISFNLFDVQGNNILYKNEIENQELLPLHSFHNGAYIAQFLMNDSITSSEKIVIFQ